MSSLLLFFLFMVSPCFASGPPPVIIVQPLSLSVLLSDSVSFTVVATSGTTLSYQWRKNGVNIAGATNSLYLIALVTTNAVGTYSVKVVNSGGYVVSSNATLRILGAPVITTQPASQTLSAGQTAAFSVGAFGIAPLNYQWRSNGTNLSSATNVLLTLTNVQPADAASYSVVITNLAGSVTSSVATLTVYVPPTITSQPQSQWVVKGKDVSFSVAASGSSPFTYQWYLDGSKLGGGSTSSSLAVNNVGSSDAGDYTVVVANAGGSVTSLVATLTVIVAPSISSDPNDQTVVQGQTAAFSVTVSGSSPLSYQWNVNGTNIADGPDISGSTSNILRLGNVQAAQSGNVFVVITNMARSVSSSVCKLTVNVPAFISTQPQSQTVVLGQPAAFTVGAGGTATLKYQWYFNGAKMGAGSTGSTLTRSAVGTNNLGDYTVVVNNNWGSVTSAVATLSLAVPPTITNPPASQALSEGQSATFAVGASGTAPLNYQWSFNGTNLADGTNALLTLTNIQTTDAGSYSVVLTNIAGSATSAVAALTVYVPPTITTQPQSLAVTQGQNAAFAVLADGSSPFTYQWYFNGTNISGATNLLLTVTNIQTADAGDYAVVVANNAGAATSSVATLTVSVPPTITHQPQSQALASGQPAVFSVGATGTGTLGYQWFFNGAAMTGASAAVFALTNIHASDAGGYSVVVTNVAGSVTSTVANLTVTNPVITLAVNGDASMTASGFAFQLSVPVGATYVIMATTDLLDWTPIETNVSLSESAMFTDSAATGKLQRLYRVVVP